MTPDFSGEVGLNLALGLVTSCCSCQTTWWRPACCWLGWGSMSIGDPSKSHKGGSGALKKQMISWLLTLSRTAISNSLSKLNVVDRRKPFEVTKPLFCSKHLPRCRSQLNKIWREPWLFLERHSRCRKALDLLFWMFDRNIFSSSDRSRGSFNEICL